MNREKIKLLAEAVIGENLIVPEICVITRDDQGEIKLWWTEHKLGTAENMLKRTWDCLYLSLAGGWSSCDPQQRGVVLGVELSNTHNCICRKFQNFDNTWGDRGCEILVSEYVTELINRLARVDAHPVEKTEPSLHQIKTVYEVNGLTFGDLKQAERHVKIEKMYDAFVAIDPDIDFPDVQSIIEAMVDDPQKFTNLLKGI